MPKVDNTLFYEKSLNKYGATPQGVHWNSKESQYIRFKTLLDFIPDIKNSSICDAGCGYGELYQYLLEEDKEPKRYIGFDVEELMISLALEMYHGEFYQKDILKDPLVNVDYYLCSGAMNILTQEESFKFITNCYLHSKKGFVFNILEANGVENHNTYNGFEVDELINFCKTLSHEIKYKTDYIDGDITVFMKR